MKLTSHPEHKRAILNSKLWNSGVESDKDVARAQKQKIEYYSNVLVLKDPENPENEGKVFIYRYGPMIFEMIQEKMFPKFEDEDSINPFDLWDGCNFNIKMIGKTIGKDVVPNYEKSTFSSPVPLFGGDEDKLEAVYEKCHKLSEFSDEKNFKTEEELKRKLFDVLGPTVGSGVVTVEGWGETPVQATQSRPVERKAVEPQAIEQPRTERVAVPAATDDDDDDLAFLKNLVRD